ncbi:site-specific integrase [Ferdinandcohnia sp. SAFN-114]|uniref:site-specific integrase n=1 Tax=Ferdinandcohnia sp. SAFN-114 TaxID=3387275 RepID=UPI003F820980
MITTDLKPQTPFYEQLLGMVNTQLLHLRDTRDTFIIDKIDEFDLNYYFQYVMDKPWNNHLFLYMIVGAEKNLDPRTILNTLSTINSRMKDLFKHFHLTEMEQLSTETHMYEYFKGTIYKNHSDSQRAYFLTYYRSLSYETKKWVSSKLPVEQREDFEKFIFPMPSYDSGDFHFTNAALAQGRNTRKSETDAIVPFLTKIRAEGHFRWNQIDRLRKAYLKACEQAKTTNAELPLYFDYKEPRRVGERFYFRLWDKPSFVLNHKDQYSKEVVRTAERRIEAYSVENNHYFVEFIRAERMDDEDEAEGLWFIELIENDVIGGKIFENIPEDEKIRKIKLLYSWGYGDGSINNLVFPFNSQKGVLTPSRFVSRNKDKAEGSLFDMESYYVGVTFGLLALDICTSTGARINELLQINYTKECLKTFKLNNSLKYSFYAIPKGRDEPEQYYITDETMKLFGKVRKMLQEHYGTEKIPSVNYSYINRKHLFKKPKPYFFQYHKKALNNYAITASLRFLLHGLHFETQEGTLVTVKPHLLRHAFATEAVQRQNVPLDIIAKILHQRDLDVTGYYSEPTPSQVAQAVSDLHNVVTDYIDIDDAVLRNPNELQQELNDYKEKVGVFNNVLGGVCVTNMVCPVKMACLGCQAKIPQPEKKHELEEVIELSKDMEKRFTAMNLPVEVKKAKEMRKHARNELKEIDLIEKYREEQKYEPHIQFDK